MKKSLILMETPLNLFVMVNSSVSRLKILCWHIFPITVCTFEPQGDSEVSVWNVVMDKI